MASTHSWSNSSNTTSYINGESYSRIGAGIATGGERIVQKLWFTTGDTGGTSFNFTYYPYMYWLEGSGVYFEDAGTLSYKIVPKSEETKYYNITSGGTVMSRSSGSTVHTVTNQSYVFLPNTEYCIFLYGTSKGFYLYSYGSSFGSATLTINGNSVYNLTTNATNSTIKVTCTESPLGKTATDGTVLNNNTTIYHGDKLKITFEPDTGYNIDTHTVNDSSFTSGNTHTVSSDVTVKSTASVKYYKLTVTEGKGSDITITCTSSPLGGVTTPKDLSSGGTIYYNDVLTISFKPIEGYNLATHTVNGSPWTSGVAYTVSDSNAKNVTVASTATVKSYTLTVSKGEGSSITITRTNSPLKSATETNLSGGGTIYHGDVLQITTSADIIHEILNQTITTSSGTASFTSGDSHAVKSDVTVATTTRILGIAHISNGTEFETYLVYIYDDDGWSQYIPYIYDGTNWVVCN